MSHEYHYLADVGEDEILSCKMCSYTANTQLSGQEKCPQCGSTEDITFKKGIEVYIVLLFD